MLINHTILKAELGLFDGAAAGTAGAASDAGASAAPGADINATGDNIPWDKLKGGKPQEFIDEDANGVQNTEEGSADNSVSVESWQKAKELFREDYDKDVEKAVKRRLKNTQSDNDTLKAENDGLKKIRDYIALKYPDVDKNDMDALFEAVKGDDVYLKQRALDNGNSVEKEARDIERELEVQSLREQLEQKKEAEALRATAEDVHRQVQELKQVYPDFDLEKAYENEDFALQMAFYQKVKGAPNVRAAYEAAFGAKLREQAVHQTADATRVAISQNLKANQYMPSTAGKSSSGKAAVSEFDITNMSARELVERKRNGEDISKYLK